MKRYPKSLCDNPVCRQCHYYGRKSKSCDYFMKTGKRKNGNGETCDSFTPNRMDEKKKQWLHGGRECT